MSKKFKLLLIILSSVITLSSCNLTKTEWHPTRFPMSKWEGDNLTLYILNQDINNGTDLILIDLGEEKLTFDVWWHGNGLWNLDIIDRNVPTTENAPQLSGISERRSVGSFDLKILDEKHSELRVYSPEDIPEDFFPNDKIVLECTATDLKKEDIPIIDTNDYSFCPTYCYGSLWLSEDKQISIKILPQKKAEHGIGEVTFSNDPNVVEYMKFARFNSSAYIGEFGENELFYFNIRNANEEWKCEYSEDSFIATVVHSHRFKQGEVFSFYKVIDQ